MRKTSNIAIAVGIIPDLILGGGFDLTNEYNIKDLKKRIVEAVQFEVGLTYGGFSDKETLSFSDVTLIRQNDDNPEQIDILIKQSFNHLIMSISEFKLVLEKFYMGVIAYFDKLGFKIVMSAEVCYMWEQGDSLNIELLKDKEHDLYLQSEDCQRQLTYIMFRDSESFTVDEMEDTRGIWEKLTSELTEDEEDNTYKPRSSDDILRDLLGGNGDGDED